MPQKYLLPCSCGESILIELSQAGERIRCQCGNELEVPTMRHIRQLQRAADTGPVAKPRKSWPMMYGLLFAVGLATTVAGLAVAGYYQWGRSQLQTEETQWDDVEAAARAIDKLPADVAFDEWRKLRDFGLGAQTPPEFVIHRHVSGIWLKIVWIGLGVAGIGLLIIAIAVALPRPKTRRQHRSHRTSS